MSATDPSGFLVWRQLSRWRRWFLNRVYATHNNSSQIKAGLGECLNHLEARESAVGLNVGAGFTDIHPRMISVDIAASVATDCLARAEALPFGDASFMLVVSQEVLEHVRYPGKALSEMYRVLQEEGLLYCQLPFIIGYHPGPTDFWRFTREGIQDIIEQAGFKCTKVVQSVGPATGFYRIAVEFFAVFIARFLPRSYFLAKGLIALLLYPLKWLDPFLSRSQQADRIAGGYYVIAKKPSAISGASETLVS